MQSWCLMARAPSALILVCCFACDGATVTTSDEHPGDVSVGRGDGTPPPEASARDAEIPDAGYAPDGVASRGSDGSTADGSPPTAADGSPPDVALPPPGGPDAATPRADSGEPPAPACEPPDSMWVGDRCVPSCGIAGGNTCVGADSTLCDFLPALESYDCARCCARPDPAPVAPRSFHTVVIAHRAHWDSVLDLSQRGLGPMITSQNKPEDLPFDQWANNLHWEATGGDGATLADEAHARLGNPAGAPAFVLVDELRTNTQDTLLAFARRMAARYPQYRGRWGAYLGPGEAITYAAWTPAIDALLEAGAILVPEMYFSRESYCRAGAGAGDRDIWLGRMFRGDERFARVHWLVQRARHLGSDSRISPILGVIDRFIDGPRPAVYLDRMFYVWMTRSEYPGLVLPENGGMGAWKWDGGAMENTSRDLAFAQSFDHYLVQRRADSRLGQVDCD